MRRPVVLLASAALLAACSQSAEPQEVSALSKQLQSKQSPVGVPLPKDRANCVAKIYLEAGLSDKSLKRLQDGKSLAATNEDDQKAVREINQKIASDCL